VKTTVNATYTMNASVDRGRRRIVGLVLPYGQEGTAALGGEPATITFEAGSLSYGDAKSIPLVVNHTGSAPVFAGRARDLIETPEGIVATFSVLPGPNGDQLLAEAAEGLRTGLSIEAEVEPEPGPDGTWLVTAARPGVLKRVAAVETPAFPAARMSEVAASKKESTMSDTTKVEAAEVPDDVLSGVITNLTDAVSQLNQSLAAPAAAPPDAAAAGATIRPNLTAGHPLDGVKREAFPYGFDSAEGGRTGLFRDIVAGSKGDTDAARRVEKAKSMMAEHATGKVRGQSLEAANEPVVRSTLIVPNVYDIDHYVNSLVAPRVIADKMPGVAIDRPNPIVVPAFSSRFADGGSGEPVVASTEGTNPAQAELATTSITVTPIWYTGLFDVSRQAIDAAAPGTDALVMKELINSYNITTEAAAVTAILANGTAGTDSVTNADVTDVEPKNMLYAIRKNMATQLAALYQPTQSILMASDVYQAAVGATNTTSGNPLYAFQDSRYQLFNQAGAATAPAAGILDVYGVPAELAYALTATKVVLANWGGVLRWESPLYEFRLDAAQPASYRFAVGGYFVQRTLQAKAVYYFAQA
jgi:hypothetical protein